MVGHITNALAIDPDLASIIQTIQILRAGVGPEPGSFQTNRWLRCRAGSRIGYLLHSL
jgi:hypothetical protein